MIYEQDSEKNTGQKALSDHRANVGDVVRYLENKAARNLTLTHIDPCIELIEKAYKSIWKGVKLPDYKDEIIV